MSAYHQEVILAMELDRSHIGKLVQIITDSWSMTGTLSRVDQHDNREWEVAWPSGNLVPSGGEIYAELWIGPWVGRVIGNQPVTVETVKGTLEAPETATRAVTALITDEEVAEARAKVIGGQVLFNPRNDPPAIEGAVVENPPPEPPAEWVKHSHRWVLDVHYGYRCECGESRPLDWPGNAPGLSSEDGLDYESRFMSL